MNDINLDPDPDWDEAGVTAIFLWQGFMAALGCAPFADNKDPVKQELYDSHFDGLGQDGGASSVSYVASKVEDESKHWIDYEFPGVYHYEITEVLGTWWAKEGPKLHEFQYGEDQRNAALKIVVDRYNELMAAWLATEKLIG